MYDLILYKILYMRAGFIAKEHNSISNNDLLKSTLKRRVILKITWNQLIYHHYLGKVKLLSQLQNLFHSTGSKTASYLAECCAYFMEVCHTA